MAGAPQRRFQTFSTGDFNLGRPFSRSSVKQETRKHVCGQSQRDRSCGCLPLLGGCQPTGQNRHRRRQLRSIAPLAACVVRTN